MPPVDIIAYWEMWCRVFQFPRRWEYKSACIYSYASCIYQLDTWMQWTAFSLTFMLDHCNMCLPCYTNYRIRLVCVNTCLSSSNNNTTPIPRSLPASSLKHHLNLHIVKKTAVVFWIVLLIIFAMVILCFFGYSPHDTHITVQCHHHSPIRL